MKTSKISKSGSSQAIRIPKEFQLEGDEVEIIKRGKTLALRPKKQSWAALFNEPDAVAVRHSLACRITRLANS